MNILSINADRKLFEMASYIGSNPLSWQGWLCLHIHMRDIDYDLHQECLLWTKSIVESYLKDIEGRVYFCDSKDIHILCKIGENRILHQTGQNICDLISNESKVKAYYTIYDLVDDGFAYSQSVIENIDNIFTMPFSVPKKLDNLEFLEPQQTQTKDSKPQGDIKVLLVEDDPVTRWMVRNVLKNECEFVTASTANKAFGMYSSYQPDVVFLDINLPDNNGYAVLEWIMRNDPGACVVMFSSNDNLDNIAGALEDGAIGFIAKPFLKEDLVHYIHRYAER